MVSTVADVLAPVTETEFRQLLRERRVVHFKGGGHNRFRDFVDWPRLLEPIESGAHPLKHLQVTRRNGATVPRVFYTQDERPVAAKLSTLLESGASCVFRSYQTVLPALETLADNVRKSVREQIGIAAVVTTGEGGALQPHFDASDVLAMQVEGSKRWRIYGSPRSHPIAASAPMEKPPDSDFVFDDVIEAGDALLVPSGYWHYCENGPGRSIHVAILLHPLKGKHVIEHLQRVLLRDEEFRRPILRHCDEADLAGLETAMKARLIREIEQLSLAELRDLHQQGKPDSDY